ncbi:PBP1A family penicillin-binding protein [Ruminococcaceae bacterium OttesenSCG-928-L11]|nr:PBP1A family penicillin-binding protein [Ruminococcaceae bacterium OttesenSCG-928-L11]
MGATVRGIFLTIGRVIATFIMVGIITGCIVACVMTVYVLRYIGAEDEISIDSIKMGYTSIIYATNSDGELYELQRLYNTDGNRIWVDYDDINQYTKDAMVAIEDKRFWTHDGVDWRRSFGAFVNLFLPGASRGGGSTIHQQLVKNVTKDDDYRIDRKVREIFRAINLGQNYTHEQVLEAYLNVVPFGNNTNGIQAAANTYFSKEAKDLTLAEAACIVGITQKPTANNPFLYPEANKNRQEHVLSEMFKQERITEAEYEKALKEPLNFKKSEHYESINAVQSYFVDHVIEAVIADLMEMKGWTYTYAAERLYKDGYKIYTTMDAEIQTHLENYYSSWDNFPQEVYNEIKPQSACVITDLNGKILGLVGGVGEKTVSRGFNRATMAKRHPGSSIKPIGVYALAMEYNQITWSTLIDDNPIELTPGRFYPSNFDHVYRGPVTVDYAIQKSVNTVAVRLTEMLTPKLVYDFLTNRLHMNNLVEYRRGSTDIDLGPMALGSLTDGLTPLEMAGGYQIFANGGYYTEPYCYTKVEDAEGKVVLQADTTQNRVISEETAGVMTKLLQRVTTGPNGTGVRANLPNMPTAGKTGTSTDDVDQWFVGFTPYYVCQVWLGYDEKLKENNYGEIRYRYYPPPYIFRDIMEPLHEELEYKNFEISDNVVSMTYCTRTGDLASTACTSIDVGWYKKSNLPPTCSGNCAEPIVVAPIEPEDDDDAPRPITPSNSDDSPRDSDDERDR